MKNRVRGSVFAIAVVFAVVNALTVAKRAHWIDWSVAETVTGR
jgi:hypothetical protein